MGKDHDFLEEEVEEQNQPLIKLLHDVYQPGQQDERSLARMRERLLSGDAQLANTQQENLYDRKNVKNLSDRKTQPERIGSMHSFNATPKTSKSQQWRRSLMTMAAVLTVALVIGSFVVILNLMHRPSLATKPTPVVIPTGTATTGAITPTAQVTPQPALPHTPTGVQSIHMVNSNTGWVLCVDGSVLRTTDGGLNWVDVTPPALVMFKQSSGAQSLFLDSSTAWILVRVTTSNDLRIATFHTSDAGQNWQEGTIKRTGWGNNIHQITAISTQEAWILDGNLADPGPGDNYVVMTGLDHTTDGGKTWIQVQTIPAANQIVDSPAISFADQHTGIITSSLRAPQPSGGVVHLTQDGGAHWRSISIQSPDPAQWILSALLFPQFLTPTDGTFIASYHTVATQGVTGLPSGQGFSVFSTHDGGQTWTSSPIVNIGDVGGTVKANFVDTQHGYVLASVGQVVWLERLYITSDSGQHWNAIDQHLPLHTGLTLFPDFSSLTTGWVLYATQAGAADSVPTSLYTTTDGGKTWAQVHAHFPPFITP